MEEEEGGVHRIYMKLKDVTSHWCLTAQVHDFVLGWRRCYIG